MNIEIIVTDDDHDFRSMMRQMLEPTPHRVTLCEDGIELMQALGKSNDPAVIYLDIYMDKSDGIKAIKPLQSVDRRMRVRFVTGGAKTLATAATLIAKAHDIDLGATLFKPFSQQEFMNALGEDTASLLN